MSHSIQNIVQSNYAAVANSDLSTDHAGVRAVAEAFGYSSEELSSIPAEANMGLSCGNPTAHASLRPGEVVVDLGCGGGLDVFLAAARVGPNGKAIGIDMTPDMIGRARKNAAILVEITPIPGNMTGKTVGDIAWMQHILGVGCNDDLAQGKLPFGHMHSFRV